MLINYNDLIWSIMSNVWFTNIPFNQLHHQPSIINQSLEDKTRTFHDFSGLFILDRNVLINFDARENVLPTWPPVTLTGKFIYIQLKNDDTNRHTIENLLTNLGAVREDFKWIILKYRTINFLLLIRNFVRGFTIKNGGDNNTLGGYHCGWIST